MNDVNNDKDREFGEGNYKASRAYQKDQREFAQDRDRVAKKAHEAEEALDSDEGEDLERARKETAKGDPLHRN